MKFVCLVRLAGRALMEEFGLVPIGMRQFRDRMRGRAAADQPFG